ncbi:hypothetical protein JD844_001739 [Phrynosoma platyrhinos]|uniref:Natterin-4 n=1 Tax=Phrynosoma platyrhinos TaxID=52577 RepID=A0ABQ7TBX0_PHRPL|nr:hypothetical protein JD844_001739 [Phrynosoma platyrhinos]
MLHLVNFKMHLLLCIVIIPLIASEQENTTVSVIPQKDGRRVPVTLKRNKRSDRGNEVFQDTSLKWVAFQGTIPQGTVSLWNNYAQRREYTCAIDDCRAGFYSPNEGSFCFYPFAGKQRQSARFWLLVNENDLELLEWRSGYAGGVPSNSIGTCSGDRFYVAKNKYGLGEVDRQNTAFFIGIDGSEYWYKSYDVLTVNKDYVSHKIYNVIYFKEHGEYENEAVILKTSKVRNYDCKAIKKKTSLSKEIAREHHWDLSNSLSFGTSLTLTAGIPRIIGGRWSISVEKNITQSEGSSVSDKEVHTVEVELEVQPNHECEVEMEGIKMKAEIPFSASVIRQYKNGVKRRATVQGVSKNLAVEEVSAVVKRCHPIPDAEPCNDSHA